MRQVFSKQLTADTLIHQYITLSPDTSHHLSRVLRCKRDDLLVLFNAHGAHCEARISDIKKNAVSVCVENEVKHIAKSPLDIHLGIGVSKGKRMDIIMQKCTELGVSQITPLISEHVSFKLDPKKQRTKHAHWQQVIINACEQSRNYHMPTLHSTCHIEPWINTLEASSLKLCLHPKHGQSLNSIHAQHTKTSTLALLIGPEGGLSEQDLCMANAQQFINTELGPRILRTETAPIAILTLAQFLWGDI